LSSLVIQQNFIFLIKVRNIFVVALSRKKRPALFVNIIVDVLEKQIKKFKRREMIE